MLKKLIQLLIFLGLGVFFVLISVRNLKTDDIEMIKESALGIMNAKSLFFIFLSMVCGAFAHYFRALRNILLIDPLGYSVRKTTAFYSVMTCYLANLAIPRLGEVLRCTFLQRYDQVPFQKSLGTVVADRIFDLIVLFALFVVMICLNTELITQLGIYDNFNSWFKDKWTSLWEMKILVGCFLLFFSVVLIFIFTTKNNKSVRKTNNKQSKIIAFIKNILAGLWQGLISVKNLKHRFLFIVYTIAIWVSYYFGTYLCMYAFDFLQHLSLMPAFVVLVVGAIGFIVAQGGLGAYPLFVAGVLVLFNVDYAQGLAAGWIGWGAQTVMILVVGFTTLILASFLKVEDRAVVSD
jgi:uncharacterized protein (TIRG00374 family)